MKKIDKTGKINIVLWSTAIALCLITLIIALVGYFSFGFRTFNQNPTLDELENQDEGNINITNNFSNGVFLSSAPVGNDKLITATVEGMEGIDKTLIWDFAWKSETAWTNGKDVKNYLGLIINSDTSSALVENKAAFAEPIIVTARSSSKNDVFGTCTIDFLKKISKFEKTSKDSIIVVGYDSNTTGTGTTTSAKLSYTEGTLDPIISCTLSITYNQNMVNQINTILANNSIPGNVSANKIKNVEFNEGFTFDFDIASDLTKGPLSRNKKALNLINDLFMEKVNDLQWYCSLTLDIQLSYNTKEYKMYSYDLGNYTFDASKLVSKCATSVTLDKQQIIF